MSEERESVLVIILALVLFLCAVVVSLAWRVLVVIGIIYASYCVYLHLFPAGGH